MWKPTAALLVTALMLASALSGIEAHAGASPSHQAQGAALPCCDGEAAQQVGSNCLVCGAALHADWNAPPSALPAAFRFPPLRLERPVTSRLPWHPPA